MGSSKTTTAVEAPTLLTSGPKVNSDEKVATALLIDGKSTDTKAIKDMMEDKTVANANKVPGVDEPAPEPKSNFEATTSANEVAVASVDEAAKNVKVTQAEPEKVRGISVG